MNTAAKKKVLICDDREDRRDGWKEALTEILPASEWEIELLTDSEEDHDLDRELGIMQARQFAARQKKSPDDSFLPDERSRFDDTSILIVDYDLALFGKPGLTGERVTYLARCYSECKVVVSVNLNGQTNEFDLTLVDHLYSFADVDIGSDQLTVPVLWDKPLSGLNPWSWSSLLSLLERHDSCVEAVGDGSSKVKEAVGLGGVSLPRQITQPIEADENEDPNFDLFVRESGLGLRGDDVPWRGTVARVGAARARKWLQHLVISAQDILVDAPHLAQRNPLLLGVEEEKLKERETFARTTDRGDERGGLIPALDRHRLPTSPWTDRPLWRWADLNSDSDLPGISAPWDRPEPEFRFCEDVSMFLPPELTRSFLIDDVLTSQPLRYVAKQGDPAVTEIVGGSLSNVKYLPKLRLTL